MSTSISAGESATLADFARQVKALRAGGTPPDALPDLALPGLPAVGSEPQMPDEPSSEYYRSKGLVTLWHQRLQGDRRICPPEEPTLEISLDCISTSGIPNVRSSENEEEFRALMSSMDIAGLLNPVTVIRDPEQDDRYFLICGFRRFRAAKELGWLKIRATLRTIDSVAEAHLLNLIENLNRSTVTTFDLAVRCEVMIRKFSMKPRELAKAIGYTPQHVISLVHLLTILPESIVDDWRAAHPLLTVRRLNRFARDLGTAEGKWLRMRNDYARETTKDMKVPNFQDQLDEIGQDEEDLDDPSGWTPFRKPSKKDLSELRVILARQRLPGQAHEIRELVTGLVDYVAGVRPSIPYVMFHPLKKKKSGGVNKLASFAQTG